MKNLSVILFVTAMKGLELFSQIPGDRLSDWQNSGPLTQYVFTQNQVNFEDFNGGSSELHNNDSALSAAILFLGKAGGGSVLFSEGIYRFHKTVVLTDSIVLIGKGAETVLEFDLGHQSVNCIQISGNIRNGNFPLSAFSKNDKELGYYGNIPPAIQLIRVMYNDTPLAYNNWAYGDIGQIVPLSGIDTITGTLKLLNIMRIGVSQELNPYFQVIDPIVHAGIECLKIRRIDSTISQTSLIDFYCAMNCFVLGVECEMSNFGHVVFNRSVHNVLSRSYLHEAFAYGSGGQGYGVVIQSGSSENLIENNIFRKLRHSVLLQSGANGNVIAYNYSIQPYTDDLPVKDISGDLVCHGNYPHHNLFEGNICQNIVVDNSHGRNGPCNTFFRNRAELYGIQISAGQDSQNFVCNEVTNTELIKGQFLINGNGHFMAKNNIKGDLLGNLHLTMNDTSLYLASAPGFWKFHSGFNGIGNPFTFGKGNIPARSRYLDSIEKAICYTPIYSHYHKPEFIPGAKVLVYPNPANGMQTAFVSGLPEKIFSIRLFEMNMQEIREYTEQDYFFSGELPAGLYFLQVNHVYFILFQKI